MAKGIGLIGNFRGKVGNMVGYNLKDSNNKQTQGVRVYQPIVKNPKTYAQAEQRAKLLAVNATYRALKDVIDRGQEGLAYGNKSRLAWLKGALKADVMPWFEKGDVADYPVICQLSKGSLAGLQYNVFDDTISIAVSGLTAGVEVNTIGQVSNVLVDAYPSLKEGDQVTFINYSVTGGVAVTDVTSIVIDTTSNVAITGFTAGVNALTFSSGADNAAGSIIVSREGANGEHLRSTSTLKLIADLTSSAPYDDASKEAAIRSYMAAGANTDWAEESLQ